MEEIENLRNEVDKIDENLIELLAKRMEVVKKIGEIKKKLNLTVLDVERKAQTLAHWYKTGTEFGLETDFIGDIYKLIHDRSVKVQE